MKTAVVKLPNREVKLAKCSRKQLCNHKVLYKTTPRVSTA